RELGFSRVVLSRELSLGEIKSIRENTTIELEIFVSGALCVCYSGKCYMSSFIGARSGNRGMCAQPCRKMYNVDGRDMGYILSPKDQLMGKDEIDFLKEIGVESIKIEGRMKEAKYVHELTGYFKALIDGEERRERISRIFNRGYGKGYFHSEEKNLINSRYSFNLGKQIGIFNGKEVKISERVMLGDGVTYLSKDFEKLGGAYISKIVHRTFDKNREKSLSSSADKSKEAFPGETLIMQDIPVGTRYLFKSFDKEIEDTINLERKHSDKKVEISGEFKAELNKLPKLTFYYKNLKGEILTGEAFGEKEVEVAGKKPITAENIQDKLSELGETEFFLGNCDFQLEDNLFIPVSIIKAMKRDAAEDLIEKIADSYRRENSSQAKYIVTKAEELVEEKDPIVSAIVTTSEQEKKLKELGIDKIYYANVGVVKEKNLDRVKYDSPIAYTLLDTKQNPRKNLTLHWSLNISNRYTISEWEKNSKIETVMISPELSFEKIKNLGATKLKKALLIYSKPKVMQIEATLVEKATELKNDK
ncbi:MAG: peptidase U32 family protein, partial [Fusobacteriaceae bacterium]